MNSHLNKWFGFLNNYILLFFVVSIISCNDNGYDSVPDAVEGYVPIYFNENINPLDSVYRTSSRQIRENGNIYLYKQYLFINEKAVGVHVFDNSNPSTPVPVCFINIPNNYDISIKNGIMYANSYIGLLVIDINDLNNIKPLDYMKYHINHVVPPLPAVRNNWNWSGNVSEKIYFECIDNSKGIVVGWQAKIIYKPKCYKKI